LHISLLSALKSIFTAFWAEFPSTAGLRKPEFPLVGFAGHSQRSFPCLGWARRALSPWKPSDLHSPGVSSSSRQVSYISTYCQISQTILCLSNFVQQNIFSEFTGIAVICLRADSWWNSW